MYVDTNSEEIDFSSFPIAQSAMGCLLSLHVERPGKHIAPSCATLKINQKWSPMTSFKSTNVISEKTPWLTEIRNRTLISMKLGNEMEMIFDYRRPHIGDKLQ